MTPPLVIPPYLKEAPLTGLIGMGGGATSHRVYTASSSDAYQIGKSLRFNEENDPVLKRTPRLTGNRKTWTWAAWVKRSGNDTGASGGRQMIWCSGDNSENGSIEFHTDNIFFFHHSSGSFQWNFTTNATYRDYGAWYHIVIAVDTTQSIEAERAKLYVNGEQVTDFSTAVYPSLDYADNPYNEAGEVQSLGNYGGGNTFKYDGLYSDVYMIDGMQLTPASFGSFDSTGSFNPKTFSLPAPNAGTTWSSTWSDTPDAGSAAGVFDGTLDNNTYWNTAGERTITTGEFTINNLFRVYGDFNAETVRWKINDTYTPLMAASGSSKWNDIDLSNHTLPITVTSLKYQNVNISGVGFRSFEVDGVILVDGQTNQTERDNPHGAVNGDFEAILTSDASGGTEGFWGNGPGHGHWKQYGFDGDFSTETAAADQDKTLTLTFSPALKWSRIIEFNNSDQSQVVGINGTTVLDGSGTAGWQTISRAGGELSTLTFTSKNTGQGDTGRFRAIRIDGQILRQDQTDNSFLLQFNDTTNNSSIGKDTLHGKIEDATGGLPIYNTKAGTNDNLIDYGDVKDTGYRTDSSAGTTDGTGLIFALPGDTLTDLHAAINTGSSANTMSISGSGVKVSTDSSRLYGSSVYFNSNGHLTSAANDDFKFGTDDHTIELWFNQTSSPASGYGNGLWSISTSALDSAWPGRHKVRVESNNSIAACLDQGACLDSAAGVVTNGQWHHLAITKTSSKQVMYLDGVAIVETSHTTIDVDNGNILNIGNFSSGYDAAFDGYIQDFRVYRGVVKYTANFKPPIRNDFDVTNLKANTDDTFAPAGPIYKAADKTEGYAQDSLKEYLVFACPCNEGDGTLDMNDYHATIKGSGSNHTITQSGYTTQASSSRTGWGHSADSNSNEATAQSSDFELSSTDDFCLEFWTYIPTSGLTAHARIFNFGNDDENNIGAAVYSGGEIYPMVLGDYIITGGSGTNLTDTAWRDAWAHWAFTRDNGVVKWYLNGNLKGEEANSGSMGSSYNTMKIGGANHHTDIYYHDIRYYIGTPKYTGAFTPSRADNAWHQDSLTDTPTNYGDDSGAGGEVRGNYCTLNNLDMGSNIALTRGNLTATISGNSTLVRGTAAVQNSGKWYFEVECESDDDDNNKQIGIHPLDIARESYIGENTSVGYHKDGRTLYAGGQTGSTGSTWGPGDIIGVAVDLSGGATNNGKVTFYKNGTAQSNGILTTLDCTKYYTIAVARSSAGSGSTVFNVNTGQRAFKYAAPANHKCLCTQNLDDTFGSNDDTNNPSKYFEPRAYTGTGAVGREVGGMNFQPDLVWIKSRSATEAHVLFDAIRGATKRLRPNTQDAEDTMTNTLTAFNSDGFTTNGHDNTNKASDNYISWNWDAGTAAATPSTDGTLTPDAQWINATSGFSLIKYTGTQANATIGHGLSSAPDFMIHKMYDDGSTDWQAWHSSLNGTQALQLTTAAAFTQADMWNNTAPTDSVIHLGSGTGTNKSGKSIMLYAWTAVSGYSAFGSYTGTGNADGPFVYTGFKPAFIIFKRTDGGPTDWIFLDAGRHPDNENDLAMFPNTNSADATQQDTDFLSNGFKLRNTSGGTNGSSKIYSYSAWAEYPFKTTRAR